MGGFPRVHRLTEADVRAGRRTMQRLVVVTSLSVCLWLVPVAPVPALVVANVSDTTVNPASYPGWTLGDPGWDNVTTSGRNFVYLGDGWALSVRHVGPSTNDGESLTFSTGTYGLIPGQNFVVPNPAESGYSAETDLRLVRLNAEPGLGPVTIATAPPNYSDLVTVVTHGNGRQADLINWLVDTSSEPWTWTVSTGAYDYQGYRSSSPNVKRWGTNLVARSNTVFPTEDLVSGSLVRGVVTLSGRDVMSIATRFDQAGTAQETQAISGDSGGSLFRKNGTQWELAGMVDAILIYSGQSTSWAVYGDATTYVDLSYYRGEIEAIQNEHRAYSILGDVNLDGQVTGDGTGPWASDDVTAFVQGWQSPPQAIASVESWKSGDLNLDGKTDVSDFLLMRSALNPSASGALSLLLSAGGEMAPVPEPTSAELAVVGAALAVVGTMLVALRRRRRSWAGLRDAPSR